MNCLNPKCKKELLKTNEDGHWYPGETDKIKQDAKTDYIICEYCGAKNILSIMPIDKGQPMQYKLTSFTLV